ncbi:MAG: hypothetical protein IKJ35_09110 [Clostridia bacterium]|nr:hypothetical protein [Clostridia bacterium]
MKQLWAKSEKRLDIPLLHGTRRRAITVTPEERERFSSACHRVISFAKRYYDSGKVDWERLEGYQREKDVQFLSTVVSQYNLSDYQYGDFYLTTSYETAIDFSFYAGGEIGSNAYSQVKGFEAWGIAPDEETDVAAKTVAEEYEKHLDSEKIVLAFFGVKLADLQTRAGHPILADDSDAECREVKELYEDGLDEDFCRTDHQFRLSNPDAYVAHVLREKDFRAGFSVFTNVSDVDRFIKNHNYLSSTKWNF